MSSHIDQGTIDRMRELQMQGLPHAAIAKETFMNLKTVYRHLGPSGRRSHYTKQVTNLGRLRLKADITQAEMAERIGCHRMTYRGWERGSRTPDPCWFQKIAAALGCTVEEATKDWRDHE